MTNKKTDKPLATRPGKPDRTQIVIAGITADWRNRVKGFASIRGFTMREFIILAVDKQMSAK